MSKKTKMMTKGVSFVVAASLAVLSPFAGVGVKAAENESITLTQDDFDAAFNKTYNGTGNGCEYITYTNDEEHPYNEFILSPGNYVLGENIELGYEYGYDDVNIYEGPVSIDLGNYNFTCTYLEAEGESSSLTINGSGYVDEGAGCNKGASLIINGGTFGDNVSSTEESNLTINGGTFGYEVFSKEESNLTINGGTFDYNVSSTEESNLTINGGTFGSYVWTEYASSITINDGDIYSVYVYGIENDGDGCSLEINGGTIGDTYAGKGCSVTITGGTFDNDVDLSDCESVNISGGTFDGYNYGVGVWGAESLSISGGTFSGYMCGLYASCEGDITLSGGTYTAAGEYKKEMVNEYQVVAAVNSEEPMSGIIFRCPSVESAKTIFDDVLAEGYEYSPAITTSYKIETPQDEIAGGEEEYNGPATAYADQASFSIIKSSEPKNDKEETKDEQQEEQKEEKKDDQKTTQYKNEWVDGLWYGADGKQTYKGKGQWKLNSTGWWYEDDLNWYPQNQWQKIDGKWYYFEETGYLSTSQFIGDWEAYTAGYWWVGEDGAWDGSEPSIWRLSGDKWWFGDSTGWYAQGKWYKIGGTWYWFNSEGYWEE